MPQPVYVVPQTASSPEELVALVWGAPFFIGWVCLGYEIWIALPSIHPVLRILLIIGSLAFGFLAPLLTVRVIYALAVALAGTLAINHYAPDAIWVCFGDALFLLVWVPVAVAYETDRRKEAARLRS